MIEREKENEGASITRWDVWYKVSLISIACGEVLEEVDPLGRWGKLIKKHEGLLDI